MARKVPSPCIDVCKYKRKGHCVGCSMTKKQKAEFDSLHGKTNKLGFLQRLLAQQQALGGYRFWSDAYRRKCKKKGVDCPLDALATLAT